MPAVSLHIDAPPERVWEVVSEPHGYASWVPGTHSVGEVEGHWPERGATFRHTQGLPPLALSDTTTVVVADPPDHPSRAGAWTTTRPGGWRRTPGVVAQLHSPYPAAVDVRRQRGCESARGSTPRSPPAA